ncbi:MAG: hypothetical protein JW993_12130 [Sedimentisphaerales bacterium]|nr:hypothetical protein [Sedimentisphaerales bacterium]
MNRQETQHHERAPFYLTSLPRSRFQRDTEVCPCAATVAGQGELTISVCGREYVMNQQTGIRKASRREMLKLSGMGVMAGVAANALISSKAKAEEGDIKISYASWIHGHSMQIEYPDRIASEWRAGFAVKVEGMPGTDNWFHFAIPTPVIIDDVRLRADAVMLRFTTGSVDAFVRDVHVYDGEVRIAAFNDLYLALENAFVRLPLPDRPLMAWGLGISIGVGFGVEMMDHHMDFIAAGCDFTLREPALEVTPVEEVPSP